MEYTKKELEEMNEGKMREIAWELACELAPSANKQIEIILKEQKR